MAMNFSNLAMGAALGLSYMGFGADFAIDQFLHPSRMMTIERLEVTAGDDHTEAEVVVTRKVHHDTTALWLAIVEGHSGGRARVICEGNGRSDYRELEQKTHVYTIREYVSKDCPKTLAPGDTLSITWFPLKRGLDDLRHSEVVR